MSIGATATGNLHTRKPSGKPPVLRLCLRGLDANRLRSRFFLDNLHLIVIHDSMNSSGAMSLYRLCPFTAKHGSWRSWNGRRQRGFRSESVTLKQPDQ
ncbi:hypothetical protein LH447_13140 [Laribacter hongkongensis]|nr:hypothetical protein [Laribacter hongkongensis]